MGFNGKDYVEVKLREIWLRDGDKNNKFFFFFFQSSLIMVPLHYLPKKFKCNFLSPYSKKRWGRRVERF